MHVGIAADHGGFELKEDLATRLRAQTFLGAAFRDVPRHPRRLNKVALLEREPVRTSR
jgi:ribose 5-phosphate isomerase RpiB